MNTSFSVCLGLCWLCASHSPHSYVEFRTNHGYGYEILSRSGVGQQQMASTARIDVILDASVQMCIRILINVPPASVNIHRGITYREKSNLYSSAQGRGKKEA